jgi:hypothetical protein
MRSNDLAPKVLPHQSGARQLRGVLVVKHLVEAALVVVVPVRGGIVRGADVDDDGALVDRGCIARARERRRGKARQLAQKVDRKRLVRVERARVRDNVLCHRRWPVPEEGVSRRMMVEERQLQSAPKQNSFFFSTFPRGSVRKNKSPFLCAETNFQLFPLPTACRT